MDILALAKLNQALKRVKTDLLGVSMTSPWTTATINAGTSDTIDSEAKHYGVIHFKSSTSANSGWRLYLHLKNILLQGREKTTIIFKTPASISPTSVGKLGFFAASDASADTNAVYLKLANTTIDGHTIKASAESVTETNYTVSPGTWYRAVVEVNADVSLITFTLYADDSDTVLWTATLATNIPTATINHGISAFDAGTTPVYLLYLDYLDIILPKSRRV